MNPLADLRAERQAFVATVGGLTAQEFDSGPTLCAGWAPRDVLGHVLGTDRVDRYVSGLLRIDRVNAELVAESRTRSRDDLLAAARQWADRPSLFATASAFGLLQDVAVHHQDVLRGLGRTREVPRPAAAAILREGVVLDALTRRRLLRQRAVPTDDHRALGRGPEVRGTTEALGMWLAGRDEVATDLEFAGVS